MTLEKVADLPLKERGFSSTEAVTNKFRIATLNLSTAKDN